MIPRKPESPGCKFNLHPPGAFFTTDSILDKRGYKMKALLIALLVLSSLSVIFLIDSAQAAPGCGSGGACPSPTWWPPCDPSKSWCATPTPTIAPVETVVPVIPDPEPATFRLFMPRMENGCPYTWPWFPCLRESNLIQP